MVSQKPAVSTRLMRRWRCSSASSARCALPVSTHRRLPVRLLPHPAPSFFVAGHLCADRDFLYPQSNPFAAVDSGVEGALKLTRDRTPKVVPDLVVDVPVTLEELFSGTTKVS